MHRLFTEFLEKGCDLCCRATSLGEFIREASLSDAELRDQTSRGRSVDRVVKFVSRIGPVCTDSKRASLLLVTRFNPPTVEGSRVRSDSRPRGADHHLPHLAQHF